MRLFSTEHLECSQSYSLPLIAVTEALIYLASFKLQCSRFRQFSSTSEDVSELTMWFPYSARMSPKTKQVGDVQAITTVLTDQFPGLAKWRSHLSVLFCCICFGTGLLLCTDVCISQYCFFEVKIFCKCEMSDSNVKTYSLQLLSRQF